METKLEINEELIDLLKKHSFEDVTRKQYPRHWEGILKHGYSTDYKRKLVKGRYRIYFDYINIYLEIDTLGYINAGIRHISMEDLRDFIFLSYLPTIDYRRLPIMESKYQMHTQVESMRAMINYERQERTRNKLNSLMDRYESFEL